MPKQEKYYLKTLGCQSNMADSDRIRWVLESSGYKNTESENNANIIVYNTCSVRESAENRIFGRNKILKKLKEKNPKIKTVLTGCMMHYSKHELHTRLPYIDYFLHIKDIATLPSLLGLRQSKRLSGRTDLLHKSVLGKKLEVTPNEYLSLPPKRNDNIRAWVPISYGCNNFCSYCIVPFSRGREYSRPTEEILQEIKDAVKNGAKEIWLLGQNVNSYGMVEKTAWDGKTKKGTNPEIKDGCVTFSNLIREVNKIPGNFWIRFTSAHPKDFSDDLIEAMAGCDKFPKYINLPVQSGDNDVLKRMNRQYTREHFTQLVNKIRSRMPNIAISTDTIVGFCNETEEEFAGSIQLYKELKFDMAFIAEYSSRSGTAASISFKDNVPHSTKEERRKKLNNILKKTAEKNSKPLLGKTITVLLDEEKNGRIFGKSPQNKTVEIVGFPKAYEIGDFAEVKIIEIGPWILKGELI